MKKLLFLVFAYALLYSCSNGNSSSSSEDINTQLVQFDNHIFSGSGNCAQCHSNLQDSNGNDVSIDSDWRSTMMANASKDPLWQAKVHSEVLRNLNYSEQIEQKCSRCHMPMANVEANHENDLIKIFGNDGFLSTNNKYHIMAMDGVSCTVCHQIQNTNLGTQQSFTGGFEIDLTTAKPDRQIFGPYQNPLTMPMRRMAGYTPTYSSHIEKAELCATCHTLYTSPVDNQSVKFPEQTPYLEWENSIYGDGTGNDDKSCQDCHMPLADGSVKISNRPDNLSERSPFYKHYFVGGNVYMLTILKNNISVLGLTANTSHFDKTIQRTKDMLQNKTATISIGNTTISNNILEIPITINVLTGHKFPSGYPARRAWIYLIVKDANGNIVFESGKVNNDGSIVGNDADTNLSTYEPHYDVITSQDQVQIYETIMADGNGNTTYTLMNAHTYLKDNRLLPKGFDKSNAIPDIAVIGNAFSDTNFLGGSDNITYQIDISNYNAPFTVEVYLKYQSIGYNFFADLIKTTNSGYVDNFKSFYNSVSNTGEIVASDIKTIQ